MRTTRVAMVAVAIVALGGCRHTGNPPVAASTQAPGLAVEAAAWYLHDLAAQLPAKWPARYTKDELLALGYNAGPGSMLGFARGDEPGPVAQGYLDQLHANWDAAARALR